MKVKISTVHGPGGMLYPRDTYTVIRSEEHHTLVETDTGARQWVGNSFLLKEDGGKFEPRAPSPAAPSNPVISDEMVERVFQSVAPFIEGTAWREVRAALTASLSVKPQSGGDQP